jgi:Ca-activated chloride channel family protein
MSFIWPAMLVLVLLIPLLVWFYARMVERRGRIAATLGRFGGANAVPRAEPGRRRHVPFVLFLLAFALLVLALARPKMTVSLPRIEGTIILAFDVSGSMAADDMEPTRMDAAKMAVEDFVQHQPSTVQIGVVAFSDSGLSVQAPTYDQGAVLGAIARLTPQRGTSLGNGILTSLNAIEQASKGQQTNYYSNMTPTPPATPTPVPPGTYTSGVIILLTDGDNNESPDPLAAAQEAANRGVRIYTVGVGSPAGTNVHIDGFTLNTKLDEATLQQISQMTSGTYYNAASEEDLHTIYANLSPQLVIKPQETEITALLAVTSIVLLLAGGVVSLVWFGRLP